MPRRVRLMAPLLFALAGCGGAGTTPPKPPAAKSGATATASAVPNATTAQTVLTPADALKALKEEPSPELLTAAFKKTLTGKSGGSADWSAGIYARSVAEKLSGESPVASGPLLIVPAGSERLLARVAVTPEGARFDWLQLVPAGPAVAPAELPQAFAALAFLGSLAAERDPLAVGLLTPAARARLAPPRDAAEKALGYAPGILQLRLKSFRGRATGFTLGSVADPGAVTATWAGGSPRPVTLKLVKSGEGFAVDDFAAR